MVKFDFLDKFTEQNAKRGREHAELARREASALEEVHALKAEYEKVFRESLVERIDKTGELDALHDKIEAAEKYHARRQQERLQYSTVVQPEITAEDVVREFNQGFIPAFNKERMRPALDRLLAAKVAYIDAIADYFTAEKEFEAERAATRGELSEHYQYKLQEIGLTTMPQKDHYMLNEHVARRLYSHGTRPADFNPERKMF